MIKRCFAYLMTILPVTAGWAAEQPQIEWLCRQQTNTHTGLVQSYEASPGDYTAWTYDQALAVIAFTDAGRITNATAILDTMRALQLTAPDGAWCEVYNATNASPAQWKYVSGPIAWMVMAINFYEARTGSTNYAATADRALRYLDTMRDANPSSESFSALRFSNCNPEIISTEHNLDAYSAYLFRGLLNSNSVYLVTASNILEYLAQEMWGPSTNCNWPYADPPTSWTRPNVFWSGWSSFAYCTDPQTWGVLALGPVGPNGEEFYRCMEWIWANPYGNTRCTQDFSATIRSVDGFKSGTGETNCYIWVEGTEGVAAAFRRVGDYGGGTCTYGMATNYSHAEYFHQQMAKTTNEAGGLVHSFCGCFTETNCPCPITNRWPENWRYNHIASVAWYYFNERGLNPFSPNIPHKGQVLLRLGGLTNCVVQIGWDSVAGWPYKVQWRSNLAPSADTWHDLGASTNGTGAAMWFCDCTPLQTQRFYRVVMGK